MSSGTLWSGEGYAPTGIMPRDTLSIALQPYDNYSYKKEELTDLRLIRESEYKEEIPDPHILLDEPKVSKNQALKNKEWELKQRERTIKSDKIKFIEKFVDLYYHYLSSKNISNNRSFHRIKLGPYTLMRYTSFNIFDHNNHRLAIYNKRKILFKIKDSWYNDFDTMKIMKFESHSIYELEEFYNLFIDIINGELRKKEEALDDIDLTNISLKELI